jgi:hypothetical protein
MRALRSHDTHLEGESEISMIRFFSRPTPHDHARALGTLGGKARKGRAEQQAATIRATTQRIRSEIGLGPHEALR